MSADLVRLLRWTELVSVLFMCGLIWFVQVVHYPLFAKVSGDYAGYQAAHVTRVTWVVAVPMLAELGAGVLLAIGGVGPWSLRVPATVLLGVVWLSTVFLQVPMHDVLARGFDPAAHARLVDTNWIRTVGWTARAALCVAATLRAPI